MALQKEIQPAQPINEAKLSLRARVAPSELAQLVFYATALNAQFDSEYDIHFIETKTGEALMIERLREERKIAGFAISSINGMEKAVFPFDRLTAFQVRDFCTAVAAFKGVPDETEAPAAYDGVHVPPPPPRRTRAVRSFDRQLPN